LNTGYRQTRLSLQESGTPLSFLAQATDPAGL
jgi:hypothetical protein